MTIGWSQYEDSIGAMTGATDRNSVLIGAHQSAISRRQGRSVTDSRTEKHALTILNSF